jgi:hypothetical protein
MEDNIMTPKLTLFTSIVLTAAMTAAGTYYVATNDQPGDNRVAEAANQSADSIPVAVNQQPNKPVEIIIKTEIVEKHRPSRQHDFVAEGIAARSRPQPHYEVLK